MSESAERILDPVLGHDEVLGAWSDALVDGRMHHAWLLQGPRGVGKAHTALRLAAGLLGVPDGAATHPVAELIFAGSHPDLRVLRVPLDDKGKPKSEIPVDSVRELTRFFSMRPAMGGWRVAIVDSLGELNRNGANALLKTLEEPPARCVLLLVSHDGHGVLPTIRSRCRVVRLRKLSQEHSVAVLDRAGISQKEAEAALKLAPGQPGLAAALGSAEGLAGARAASGSLVPGRQMSAASLGELVKAGGKSQISFDAALSAISRELLARAHSEPDVLRAGRLGRQASDVQRLWREAQSLTMDRSQALVRVAELIDTERKTG